MNPDISIILPFFNEESLVGEVLGEVLETCPGAEIIAIDDGSSDKTWETMCSVDGVRCLRLSRNRGQSAAMLAGLRAATRPVVVLMDGDGQNDPADIPRLLDGLEQADMVCGYRADRQDVTSRRWASIIANKIRRAVIKDGIRDTGCSLKCFRREAVAHLVAFNGMHRYMAAIMKQAGLTITEVPVNHRQRFSGTSKYTNWGRALRGIYDLVGVSWLLRRKVPTDINEEKPG